MQPIGEAPASVVIETVFFALIAEPNHKIWAEIKFLLTVYAFSIYLYALVKNLTYFIT